jgi:hypothetical protein
MTSYRGKWWLESTAASYQRGDKVKQFSAGQCCGTAVFESALAV